MDKNCDWLQYEKKAAGVCVTGCISELEYVQIPSELEGLPVVEIGDYAFSRGKVKEIVLPAGLRKIGRYAFYNCESLEELSLFDNLRDIGSGAFNGCHHVRRIQLEMTGGERSVMQELLTEFTETLEVWCRSAEGTAHLFFPEYYEQGVENTPARIIENHTFGSGLKYRNCFVNRQLQYHEYDRMFPYAEACENETLLIDLALARLLHPFRMSGEARQKYESFLAKTGQAVFRRLIDEKNLEGISYLTDRQLMEENEIKAAAVYASEKEYPRAVGILMRAGRPGRGNRLDFDLTEL